MKDQNIELPPLPSPFAHWKDPTPTSSGLVREPDCDVFTGEQMQEYVIADRQRRGELVAWADPKAFENFRNLARLGGTYAREWMWANPASGLVPLYAGPQPAEPVVKDCLTTAEPVCTCPSGDGSLRWPCPTHPIAEPVKVPSDAEIWSWVLGSGDVMRLVGRDRVVKFIRDFLSSYGQPAQSAAPILPITQTKITQLREQGYTDYPVSAVLSDGVRHCIINPHGVVWWAGRIDAPVAAQPSVLDTIYLGCARMGMAGASDDEVLNYVRTARQQFEPPVSGRTNRPEIPDSCEQRDANKADAP